MKSLVEKPHLIFLISIPIIVLFGILSRDATLNINVHDTYLVIAHLHFAVLISILFAIIGVGYWIMQKWDRKLSKWLNWTHIGLTFGGSLIIWILNKFYRTEIMEYEFNNNLTLTITLIIVLMTVGQLIFLINIIYGLTKKKNKTGG